jgi:integrase
VHAQAHAQCGLRASEVLGLTWADLDLQTGKFVVRRGKGDKDRQLWINDDVLGLLRRVQSV